MALGSMFRFLSASSIVQMLYSKLQLGSSGPLIKNNSGVVEARNSGDSDYAIVRVGDAAGDDDALNRITADARYGQDAVRMFRMTGTTSTVTATGTIPANAYVTKVSVVISTALDGSATLDVGTTGTADLFVDQLDTVPGTASFTPYESAPISVGGSAVTPRVTIGGSPTTGAFEVDIYYTVPST